MDRILLAEFMMVGAGGFIGSGLRYVVAISVQRLFPFSAFPYGTVTVNVIGCFLIGYIANALELRGLGDPAIRLFLIAGILGGFTTFSAFSYENLVLLQDARPVLALANILVQVTAGFGAAWAGFQIARVF
jgi:CrcB protein